MKTILFMLLLSLAICLKSQQGQECAPGACTIKEAGNYNIELSGCYNYLDIYVYDKQLKPLRNVEITGYAEFHYLDETVLRSEFRQYYRTNSLRAKIAGPGFYNCRVNLNIAGENVSVYFDNECDLRAENN
jgi:hypothetical protein